LQIFPTPLSFSNPAQKPLSNLWKIFTDSEARVLLAADGEDLVILACTVFDWSTRVTDRQTDGQTGLRWLSHATAIAAVALKNKRMKW